MFSESFWQIFEVLEILLAYIRRINRVRSIEVSLALLLPFALSRVVKYVAETDLPPDEQMTKIATVIAILIGAFLLRAPITY